MKPSEKIDAIMRKLISDDWVLFGGNRFPRDIWDIRCEQPEVKAEYQWKALMLFLDNSSIQFSL